MSLGCASVLLLTNLHDILIYTTIYLNYKGAGSTLSRHRLRIALIRILRRSRDK
jgi:hypothetical protein